MFTTFLCAFLFFPVLRRGSVHIRHRLVCNVSILPRLATGISDRKVLRRVCWCFYSSPSCDGDHSLPFQMYDALCFYSSPSCDGDREERSRKRMGNVSILPRLATGIRGATAKAPRGMFLFFPVLRRGSDTSRDRKDL